MSEDIYNIEIEQVLDVWSAGGRAELRIQRQACRSDLINRPNGQNRGDNGMRYSFSAGEEGRSEMDWTS
jgi:hypothetical protein